MWRKRGELRRDALFTSEGGMVLGLVRPMMDWLFKGFKTLLSRVEGSQYCWRTANKSSCDTGAK